MNSKFKQNQNHECDGVFHVVDPVTDFSFGIDLMIDFSFGANPITDFFKFFLANPVH